MDLGLTGRRALVCAASKGLGRACARALAIEGVQVTITGRDPDSLAAAATAIGQEAGIKVTVAPGDITTPEGRQAALDICPDPDILVTNAGGPPPGDFRDWGVADWQRAVNANMLTPIEMIRLTIDGMTSRDFGRIVNITSASVKAPIPDLGLSNGARAGLTGFVAGLARQVAGHNVTINNLLPGPFETGRLKQLMTADQRATRLEKIPARRFGDPDEFGAACAFLCAASSGFITGQNLLIDGGGYPGVF
jgi:3-oxoacyl-[acyl-carrier protein] reductase